MDRRTFLAAGTSVALSLPQLLAPTEAAPHVSRTLASGLRVPWGITFLPDGSGLVSERDTGRIHRVSPQGGSHVVGHVPGVVSTVGRGGENGLLGLAVHPDFRHNHWLYAYLSTRHDNRVVRMKFDGNLGAPRAVLTGIPRALHHNGGGLAFGPHGYLFASTGDAEVPGRAQDRHSRSGKVLRMHPDGSVPRDNPFGSRVWSYGHRNVEGLTFDGGGRLWATELGDHAWDELNHIVRGRNYGWPRQEGRDGHGGYVDPLTQWHPTNCSPSGVAVADGRAWVGALRGESLWSVALTGAHRGSRVRHFAHRFGRIRGVHRAPDGSLWITTSNRDGRGATHSGDDKVIRIVL